MILRTIPLLKFNLESFIHLFIYLIHEKKDLICGNEIFKNITNDNTIATFVKLLLLVSAIAIKKVRL